MILEEFVGTTTKNMFEHISQEHNLYRVSQLRICATPNNLKYQQWESKEFKTIKIFAL